MHVFFIASADKAKFAVRENVRQLNVRHVRLTMTVPCTNIAAIRTAAKNVPVLVLEVIVQRMKIVDMACTVVARTTNARGIVSRNFVLLMNTARQANRAAGLSENAW